ncbi:MAG: shikimate dehydrogenase [Bacteroidota bacterium]
MKKNRYGLLGKNISYSFSKGYFTEKFKKLELKDHSYENFDIQTISEFPNIIQKNRLKGLNVTIPYKEQILSFLDEIDEKAKKIGAVNTIKFAENGLHGFNTDIFGFEESIKPFLKAHHNKALILGTGGASKAIRFVLEELGITYNYVSRSTNPTTLDYSLLDKPILEEHTVIINCTPLGTFPEIQNKPNIPYQYLNKNHLLFDLVYNPLKTKFLRLGEEKGASVCNGLKMLELQADKSWEIWNS